MVRVPDKDVYSEDADIDDLFDAILANLTESIEASHYQSFELVDVLEETQELIHLLREKFNVVTELDFGVKER
jgi:DNA polymerase IIIc chi subunit